MNVLNKIKKRWLHLRMQPIRVFCLHQVSDSFNPRTMWKCDWTQTDVFKSKIEQYSKEYTFISMSEAYHKLKNDTFRSSKYAVLTFDDGMKCLENILPWLHDKNIPITLFLSANYLDGKSYYRGYNPYWAEQGLPIPAVPATDIYMTQEQVDQLQSLLIEIAIHGWEHVSVPDMQEDEFERQTKLAVDKLETHPRYIPFYAYTYGRYNKESVAYLNQNKLIPVLCDGQKNYKFDGFIHRECIDGE